MAKRLVEIVGLNGGLWRCELYLKDVQARGRSMGRGRWIFAIRGVKVPAMKKNELFENKIDGGHVDGTVRSRTCALWAPG